MVFVISFGPVVPIVEFEDLDQAIAYANDCDYGLTSSIYTRDINVAMRACNEIRFGETYINRENFEAMQGFHAGWRNYRTARNHRRFSSGRAIVSRHQPCGRIGALAARTPHGQPISLESGDFVS